jgi:tRNA threonylcarbamoyladenosine biosynthesis protein TsaE
MKYIAKSEREMIEIGKKVAAKLKGGDILCLYGDLGAGKTTLVKGIAVGLGVKKNITSPTFAIMKQFDIKTLKHRNIKTLIHIDTYRLKNEQELLDIGVEDYLGKPDTICVIEWAEKIEKLLKKKKCVKIHIGHGEKDKREIILN